MSVMEKSVDMMGRHIFRSGFMKDIKLRKVEMRRGRIDYIIAVAMLIMAIVAGGFLSADNAVVSASSLSSEQYVTSDNWIAPAVIHDDEEVPDISKLGAFETAFDSRRQAWITKVKDQGKYETCWSFASAAVIEANLIKNGLADSNIDISENSIAYFFYNRQTDSLGYTKGDHNMIARAGYDYLTASGTLQGTGIALATGAGINTESQSPYGSTPAASLCYQGDYAVKTMYLYNYNTTNLDNSIDKIKDAVKTHGAVAAGMYFDKNYFKDSKASYYSPVKNANHAITIVGWDDNYSKDNFEKTPSRNGAWIVKNSYGTSFGDKGYMYISYADKSLSEMMSFEMSTKSAMYNNCYQHDGTGNPAYAYNSATHYANVFKAKGAGSYNEELKAVSIYTTSVGTNYEIQVYTGLTSASKPTAGTKAFSASIKGTLSDAGYQMIELPEPVSLTAGENFSIVVRLTTNGGANAYMGVDTSYLNPKNDWIRFIANVAKNQSFIKVNGKWYDMGTKLKANARIKAFTDATQTKSNFHLSASSLGVSKGDSLTVKLLASEHVHRKVTWKSTNSKVASVSTGGRIKGKKYGRATITGTFVNGAKKKSLKCKVTVGPTRIKGFNVSVQGPVNVKWNKNSSASGYEVSFATAPDGKYSKFATVSGKSKTSCYKVLLPGTYYVKMRAYRKSGKKKLYGSYTAVKEVVVP